MNHTRRLIQRLSREFPPAAVWSIVFLSSLVGLIWIGTPQLSPAQSILWLVFSALGSLGGFGLVYEMVISDSYLRSLKKTLAAGIDGARIASVFSQPKARAEAYFKLMPVESSLNALVGDNFWRMAISKCYPTEVGRRVRIIYFRDERQEAIYLRRAEHLVQPGGNSPSVATARRRPLTSARIGGELPRASTSSVGV